MSADGSIEVAVQAEGVDDAAEELNDSDGGGGVTGGGGGDGGGGGLGRLGSLGRILGVLAALVSILGPMLEFLKAIFSVIQAFLAPIALIMIRLLSPFLRAFIKLLPAWFDFIESVMPTVNLIADRLNQILTADFLSRPENLLAGALGPLPVLIWKKFKDPIKNIAGNIVQGLKGFFTGESSEDGRPTTTTGALEQGVENTNTIVDIVFNGGIGTLIERAEQNENIDFP